MGKRGKFCSERKPCRQKWLATLCLSGRRMCITWYLCSSNRIEYQPLKEKFSLSRSIDRYNADPGGQATFNSGHKITFLI